MARSVGVSIENSFINGLVTQASAFNFPENAVTDCDNVVFDERGIVSRRLGIDYESGYATKSITRSSSAVTHYIWRGAAGNGDYSFVVLQVGATLYFYRIGANASLSSGALASTINLALFAAPGAPLLSTLECQFAAGYGKLFVTHTYMNPIYVTYNINANTFSATAIDIQVRDFDGVEDGLYSPDPTTRPSTLSQEHLYNLKNQGWPDDKYNAFYTYINFYPANSDVWWLMKTADELFLINSEGETQGQLAHNNTRGRSPAPKGAYILEAFYQDRSGVSGVGGIPVVSSFYYRPTAVEFFAGRVFYSGVNWEGFNNKIYFTQVVENVNQFGFCYQENDPTSEHAFDLLPTDGGVISIPEAGTIIKLVALETSVIVFATNGIWAISGSEGTGFRANDYSVRKISTIRCLTSSSFVDVGGYPCFWNLEGVYIISPDATGSLGVKALSETKIRAFFEDIPAESKRYAKGAFNTVTKTIQWVYSSVAPATVDARYNYDRVLAYNTLSGAFYPFSFTTSTVKINGLVALEGLGASVTTLTVTDAASATVTDAALSTVTVPGVETQAIASTFKYLVSNGNSWTFAELRDTAYNDWATAASVNFDSYFVTGYKVRGDGVRKFQTNYVRIFSSGVDPSTYKIQAIWDWATSSSTGRYSSRQRITHTSNNYGTQHRKVKLRGHGVACQFRVESVAGEPFDLLGWTVLESINEHA